MSFCVRCAGFRVYGDQRLPRYPYFHPLPRATLYSLVSVAQGNLALLFLSSTQRACLFKKQSFNHQLTNFSTKIINTNERSLLLELPTKNPVLHACRQN